MTGKPCARCGSTERYASGRCAPCKRESSRAWYAANTERKREATRKWQAANPELVAAYDRKRRGKAANLAAMNANAIAIMTL